MNLLGGKTGGRFPVKNPPTSSDSARTHRSMPVLLRHSRHVYSCVPARTHTSMRVLLRHNRHRTGRSRSGASQLQETKQPRAEQPCTQQPGAKQPVPPHRNQEQSVQTRSSQAHSNQAYNQQPRAQQPGVTGSTVRACGQLERVGSHGHRAGVTGWLRVAYSVTVCVEC